MLAVHHKKIVVINNIAISKNCGEVLVSNSRITDRDSKPTRVHTLGKEVNPRHPSSIRDPMPAVDLPFEKSAILDPSLSLSAEPEA